MYVCHAGTTKLSYLSASFDTRTEYFQFHEDAISVG